MRFLRTLFARQPPVKLVKSPALPANQPPHADHLYSQHQEPISHAPLADTGRSPSTVSPDVPLKGAVLKSQRSRSESPSPLSGPNVDTMVPVPSYNSHLESCTPWSNLWSGHSRSPVPSKTRCISGTINGGVWLPRVAWTHTIASPPFPGMRSGSSIPGAAQPSTTSPGVEVTVIAGSSSARGATSAHPDISKPGLIATL